MCCCLKKKKGKERKKKRNNKIKTRLGTLSLSDIRGEISSAPVLLMLLLLFCLAWSLINEQYNGVVFLLRCHDRELQNNATHFNSNGAEGREEAGSSVP